MQGTCLVYRRSVATAITRGEYLTWLNAGSDWAQTQLDQEDHGLRHWQVRDGRGTVFGVLWRE